jgi:hypothetical protein
MRMREIFRGLLALTTLSLIAGATPASAQAPLGEADGFFAALHDGEGHVAFRYRFEYVDQDGLDEQAMASTLRTAIGYQTLQYRKLDFYIEMTNVADVGSGPYTRPGDALPPEKYPVVADPLISRVNQSFLRWSNEYGAVKGGRQELVYDNWRFVGNVVWRQNHQVFDALRADWQFAERLDLRYTFIGQVHRITGLEQDLYGHAVNAGFDLEKLGQLAAYAYLWDFDQALALNTTTFGGFWTGKYELNADNGLGLKWRAEYAMQQDAFDNPNTVEENYMHFMAGVGVPVIGVSAGYEQLGGTIGEGQFTTTFATGHKFNGWADQFLTTPDAGLNDLYVSAGGKWEKLAYVGTYHVFTAVDGDDDYGTEVDAQVSYKFDWGQSLALKGAFYSADTWATDTTKMWVFTTFTF